MYLSRPSSDIGHIISYNGKETVFRGIVREDPDTRSDHVKLSISVEEAEGLPAEGTVLARASLYPRYDYGDRIEVKCRLEEPGMIDDFDYGKYLSRYDIYSVCYSPSIRLISKGGGDAAVGAILKIKARFMEAVNEILPEPQSSFLAGLLLGAKKGMSKELMDDFSATGITHIVAVSGYNITIIAAIVMKVCQALYISRKRSFWISCGAILFFTVLTGASAAVVRSAIMGVLVLLAIRTGRMGRITNSIVLAALLMLIANPKILAFDAGFQLSFLATLGLVFVTPILDRYLKKWPSRFGIKEAFSTTLAAIIMTTPLILYQFGRLSLIAPLANIMVLPFIPINMLIGFIASLGGLAWVPFGRAIGWISWLLLSYIIRTAGILASFGLSSIDIGKVGWPLAAEIYAVIGLWILRNKNKEDEI